jgi:hypothetical protein
MSIDVVLDIRDDAVVVTLTGLAERGALASLAEGLAGVAGGLVLDVDDLWLVDPHAVRSFLHTLTGSSGAGVAFACGRLSCRQVLRRWGGPDLRVFPTVAEALASLVLEQAEQAEQAES